MKKYRHFALHPCDLLTEIWAELPDKVSEEISVNFDCQPPRFCLDSTTFDQIWSYRSMDYEET